MTQPAKTMVTVGFGKANFPDTLATYTCQRVRPPFVRESAASTGRAVGGRGDTFMAGFIRQHGELYSRRVEHDEGEIVLLQVGWRTNGLPIRDAAIFIRLRNLAASWEIRAHVPSCQENAIGGNFLMFSGHGDILHPVELKDLGFQINKFYTDKYMEPEEIDECFTILPIAPEVTPAPRMEVVVRGGQEVLVQVAAKPMRRLNFRR